MNELSAVVDKIFADFMLDYDEKNYASKTVNTNFSREVAEFGDTISVPFSVRAAEIVQVNPGINNSTSRAITPIKKLKRDIKLNDWPGFIIELSDKEMREVIAGTAPDGFNTTLNELKEHVNRDVLKKIALKSANITNFGGSGAPTDLTPLSDAQAKMEDWNVPDEMRWVAMSNQWRKNLLDGQFLKANEAGTVDPRLTGQLPPLYDFMPYTSNLLYSHTAGNIAPTTAFTTQALVEKGAAEAVIEDAGGITGNLAEGDHISFAGLDRTFVVLEATTGAGTTRTVKFAPELPEDVAGGVVVTEYQQSGKRNVAYQRDVVGLAVRPLGEPPVNGGKLIREEANEDVGFSIRIIIDHNNSSTQWEGQVLYGLGELRPQNGTVIFQ